MCNPNIWEVEGRESGLSGQPGTHENLPGEGRSRVVEEMEKQEGQEGYRAEHIWEASAKATIRSSTEAGHEETLMADLAVVIQGKKPEKHLPN